MPEFKPSLNNSSVFGSELLQRVSFRIKLLSSYRFLLWLSALRQNLSHVFYNASVSDEKIVVRKSRFFGKLALKEQFSWSIYTVKTSMLAFLCILEKLMRKKMFSFKKKEIGSNFFKKVGFRIIFCTTRHVLNQDFQTRQT